MGEEKVDGWEIWTYGGEFAPMAFKGDHCLSVSGQDIEIEPSRETGRVFVSMDVMKRFVELCEAWHRGTAETKRGTR